MGFATYPLETIFAVSLSLILGVGELGRFLAVRAPNERPGRLATLEAATLGLLALMIGFSFAMALSRFEGRREAVLDEANTIGTAALHARLLPAPYNTQALALLREYIQLRVNVTGKDATLQAFENGLNRSNAIQQDLWQQVKAITAKDAAMVPTGLYIQALSEMFNAQEKRLRAALSRLPNIVLIALYGMAAIASGFSGYSQGLEKPSSRWPVFITGVMIACVILLIQDIDRPTAGFINTDQQPILDAAATIAKYTD